MATAPVKPQQLHNFPLSLKWGQASMLSASPSASASASPSTASHNSSRRNIPISSSAVVAAPESETESEPEPAARPAHRVGSRSARLQRFSFATPCSTTLLKRASQEDEVEKKATVLEIKKEGEAAGEEGEQGHDEDGEGTRKRGDEEELGQNGNLRPWKLRPRKGGVFKEVMQVSNSEHKESNSNNNHHNNNTMSFQPKSARLRGLVESSGAGGGEVEKKEKVKFWIALSREEIEEDVFIMTGSRPARRPRKRAKNVQKVLDTVFPGLWLVGATADSFGVADVPVKK